MKCQRSFDVHSFGKCFVPPDPKKKGFGHGPDTSRICPGCLRGLSMGYLKKTDLRDGSSELRVARGGHKAPRRRAPMFWHGSILLDVARLLPLTVMPNALPSATRATPRPVSVLLHRHAGLVDALVFGWPQLGLISPLRFPSWSRYILGSGVGLNKRRDNNNNRKLAYFFLSKYKFDMK